MQKSSFVLRLITEIAKLGYANPGTFADAHKISRSTFYGLIRQNRKPTQKTVNRLKDSGIDWLYVKTGISANGQTAPPQPQIHQGEREIITPGSPVRQFIKGDYVPLQICASCRHYRPSYPDNHAQGTCHRYPPVAQYKGGIISSIFGGSVVSIRPPVSATHTCGEWSDKARFDSAQRAGEVTQQMQPERNNEVTERSRSERSRRVEGSNEAA